MRRLRVRASPGARILSPGIIIVAITSLIPFNAPRLSYDNIRSGNCALCNYRPRYLAVFEFLNALFDPQVHLNIFRRRRVTWPGDENINRITKQLTKFWTLNKLPDLFTGLERKCYLENWNSSQPEILREKEVVLFNSKPVPAKEDQYQILLPCCLEPFLECPLYIVSCRRLCVWRQQFNSG